MGAVDTVAIDTVIEAKSVCSDRAAAAEALELALAPRRAAKGGRWQVRCTGKDDLRLALAELATSIGFEFNDDEKKHADLQFDRTRRELRKLAEASAPHGGNLVAGLQHRPQLWRLPTANKAGMPPVRVRQKLDDGAAFAMAASRQDKGSIMPLHQVS